MKKIIFCVIIVFLLSSCKVNIERMHNTINEIVNNIIKNNYDINNYFHKSVGKRDEIGLIVNYYKEGKNNQERYYNENISYKYIEIRNTFGKLLNYEIKNIEYTFEPISLDDYGGHQHWVRVFIKCFYENNITDEIIVGYYLKNIDKYVIIYYYISINNGVLNK